MEISKPKTTTKPKINAIVKNSANKVNKTTKTTKTTQASKTKTSPIKTKLTKKDGELEDLEKINEENIATYRFKSKRNKLVIVLLSIMLVISIATITTYLIIIKLKPNCYMHVHGVSATFIVDDQEMSKFRAPSNLQGNRTLHLDIKLKIEESGSFRIRFIPLCYQKGVLMENTLVYEHSKLFIDGGDGSYYSKGVVEGNQTIELCNGIILDYYYEDSLNVDNFKMDFHVYAEKVEG